MKSTDASAADRLAPLRAIPFLRSAPETEPRPLTDRQRQELARIGTRVQFSARAMIYREDSFAQWVFAVADGVVKTYRDLPSGKRVVSAFLFARDLFGLAENGRYLNSAQAVTRVRLYRLPLAELAVLLKRDGELEFEFLVKLTHELREAQRRVILINRHPSAGRLAMFIAQMHLRQDRAAAEDRVVPLPMTRSDIAGFLGLSLGSVSRAAAELERRHLVKFEGRHRALIVDTAGLARLLAAT